MLRFPLLSKDISTYKLKIVYILKRQFISPRWKNIQYTVTSELVLPTNNFHSNREKQCAGNKMSEYKAEVWILRIQRKKLAWSFSMVYLKIKLKIFEL